MKLTDEQFEQFAAEHYAIAHSHGGSDADRRALVHEFRNDFNTAKRRAYIFATREMLKDAMAMAK